MNLARWCLAALTILAASGAQAIHMSPDGLGQVLIYPYYTAQSVGDRPYNTYISIVNHDGRGKALRVRFREGRNGREVGSFNLFLQAGDAWAGAVVPTLVGAAIRTVDQSCTSPGFGGAIPEFDFSDTSYSGTNSDGFGTDLARMREGYVEVLEMAIFGDITPDPADHCIDFQMERVAGAFDRPVGGISGTLTLINVADGMDFTVNAVALNDVASQKYYRPPNDSYPDFNAAEINKVAAWVQDGKLYRTTWLSGVAALDAVLMRSSLSNEIVLDSATQSGTDWIITLPTRRFHPAPPSANPNAGDYLLEAYLSPRDGEPLYYVVDCHYTLCPGETKVDLRARWASSVLAFRTSGSPGPTMSDVLGSRNAWSIPMFSAAQNGAARVNFAYTPGLPTMMFVAQTTAISDNSTGTETFRIRGAPAVGFMVRTFRNGTLTCGSSTCQGNYGGSFPHKGSRVLEPQ